MAGAPRVTRSVTRQLIIVLLLLALLIALAVAYYLMTRPPQIEGESDRDRRFLFSIYGFEGDLLRRPTGVGFDDAGNIYVADTGKKRIVAFDPDGKFLRVFGEAGREALKLWNPIDVEVTPDGRAFVVDKSQNKIVEYDVGGRAVRDIAVEEPPTSISIANDLMFVTTDSGVLIADLEGNLQTGYIKRGKAAGEFDRPGGVAVGEDGTIYVADSLNYRVQAIGTDGQPLWQYGEPIPADQAIQFDGDNRKFGLPSSIAIDENELIYVVDGLNHEIEILDKNGESIEVLGDTGHGDGAFYYPDGIDYHNGRIAVADKFNDRVEVFEVPLPLAKAWTAYLPWALLLLLLPLLLLPLLLRRQRYVFTPEAVELLVADEDRQTVADTLKRVTVTGELAAWGKDAADFELKWLEAKAPEEDVAAVVERFGLADDVAAALVIAHRLRGKRVLIGEGDDLAAAAGELEVPLVSYVEIKDALESDKSKKEKAAVTESADSGEEPDATSDDDGSAR